MPEPLIINNLESTSTVDGLSANMGRVLNSYIGLLTELETENKDSAVVAINELKDAWRELVLWLDRINGEII